VGSSDQTSAQIAVLLREWSNGDASALERLIPLVYGDLRRIAERELRDRSPNHTLQPTALVNELFLRLLHQPAANWESGAHFFATAAKAMRQLLVDYSRRRGAVKRGGEFQRIELTDVIDPVEHSNVDFIAVDQALTGLAAVDEYLARLVELRFFGGLSIEETAHVLGVSPATVKRDWIPAKAWLFRRLTGHNPES
jgi:RNA polymerase sigma factor (TIGR02999 family)